MINLQKGDLVFETSSKLGAKIVLWFMEDYSIWHKIYRIIRRKPATNIWYHPLMILNGNTKEYIEQQWQVEKGWESALIAPEKRVLVARRKGTTRSQKDRLQRVSEVTMSKKWGVLETIGKFMTFLTTIPYFARYIRWPNHHVSAVRVCQWYYEVFDETFGMQTYAENTTKTMVDYIRSNPDQWEVVYES